jgi:hypothetical protein
MGKLSLNLANNGNDSNSSYLTSSNNLKAFHQNIRGLKYKTDELLNALCPDFPHILCITEHHMNSIDRNYESLQPWRCVL